MLFLFNLFLYFAELFFNFFSDLYLRILIFFLVKLPNLFDFVLILLFQSFLHIFNLLSNALSDIRFHTPNPFLIRMGCPFNIFNVLTMRLFIHRNELLDLLSSLVFTLINLLFVLLSHCLTVLREHLLNFHILLFKLL